MLTMNCFSASCPSLSISSSPNTSTSSLSSSSSFSSFSSTSTSTSSSSTISSIHTLLSCEYAELERIAPKQSNNDVRRFYSALRSSSTKKNRYPDVLPLESTRVKLQTIPGVEGSDYINANYILDKKYISCQAPVFSSFEDFWRMVWEQNISILVMLTRLYEGGRQKANAYWPLYKEVPVSFGQITITLLEQTEYDGSSIFRQFLVKCGEEIRTVYHFQYCEWPDFGSPLSSHGILNLVRNVNLVRDEIRNQAPILVHCSAGLGRSGAFITIHHSIDLLDSGQEVRVNEIVLQMRTERVGMVQTEQQYIFIHQALSDYVQSTSFCLFEEQFPLDYVCLTDSLSSSNSATPTTTQTPQTQTQTQTPAPSFKASWRYMSSQRVPTLSEECLA